MKIFFSAAFASDLSLQEKNKKIYDEIQRLGYDHVDDDVIKMTREEYETKMKKSKEEYVSFFSRKMTGMKKADLCVFDASYPSLSIGYMINKAIEMGKPTVVVYYKESTPFFIAGIDDEKLIIREYNDKTIKRSLKEGIDIARERRDKRFNFFISPKLLEYLEKASTHEGVTKSKFIRNLIMEHMRTGRDESEE